VVFIFHPFFIVLFFIPLSSKADFTFTAQNEAAYLDFLNLRISKGQSLIAQSLKENPKNGISIYLANYEDAIKIFLSEDPKLYKQLSKNEDTRINKLQDLEKDSPYYRFTQAEVKLQWAFVKLKMGDEFSAAMGLRSAYKLLEENIKLYPDFVPNKKSMGLLNVIIGSIPSNYNWVLSLVGMEGSIDKGIEQLNEASSDDNPFSFEASILKVLVENYIVHANKGQLEDAAKLYQNNNDNVLICYLYAAILTKSSRGTEAMVVINSRPVSPELIYFPQVDLILGELNLFQGEYSTARNYYTNFLAHFKGKNTIKDTYFKIFLTYWLNNEDALAIPYLDKILNNGRELYDSDKHAQRTAKNKEIPNKVLTKIRLYTDGGYYNKAFDLMKTLTLNQFTVKREKLEYLYRSARLYHKAGQVTDAVDYYNKTIELSKTETFYFAPNSALQLGYIYQGRDEKEEARKQFKLALSYKNYEYKNSIDNKAKAALNELGK
jgi:hypothetical protein